MKTKESKIFKRNIYKHKPLSDKELQNLTEYLSMEYFGFPFKQKCTWNNRLTAVAGRYFDGTQNIEISAKHHRAFGVDSTIDTIKHELVHYHLARLLVPFDDEDATFKYTCEAIGASLFASPLPWEYLYQCPICEKISTSNLKYRDRSLYCVSCSQNVEQLTFMKLLTTFEFKELSKAKGKGWEYGD